MATRRDFVLGAAAATLPRLITTGIGGPAAAAVAHLCLDGQCSVEAAVAEMRRAGTDPRYKGLYAAPAQLRRPTRQELDRVSADFPEVAPVAALAHGHRDRRFSRRDGRIHQSALLGEEGPGARRMARAAG